MIRLKSSRMCLKTIMMLQVVGFGTVGHWRHWLDAQVLV